MESRIPEAPPPLPSPVQEQPGILEKYWDETFKKLSSFDSFHLFDETADNE